MRVGSAFSRNRHALKPTRSSVANHQGTSVAGDALRSLGVSYHVIRRALLAEVLGGRAPKTMSATLNPLYFRTTANVAVQVLRRVCEEVLEGERFRLPIVLGDVVGANGRAIDLTRLVKTIFDLSNICSRLRCWQRRDFLERHGRRSIRSSRSALRCFAALLHCRQRRHSGPHIRNAAVDLTLYLATGREDDDRIPIRVPNEVATGIHGQPANRQNLGRLRENRCLQTT